MLLYTVFRSTQFIQRQANGRYDGVFEELTILYEFPLTVNFKRNEITQIPNTDAGTHTREHSHGWRCHKRLSAAATCDEYRPKRATGKANRLADWYCMRQRWMVRRRTEFRWSHDFSATEFVFTIILSIAPVFIWINEANLRCRISDNIQSHWIMYSLILPFVFTPNERPFKHHRTHFPFTVCARHTRGSCTNTRTQTHTHARNSIILVDQHTETYKWKRRHTAKIFQITHFYEHWIAFECINFFFSMVILMEIWWSKLTVTCVIHRFVNLISLCTHHSNKFYTFLFDLMFMKFAQNINIVVQSQ